MPTFLLPAKPVTSLDADLASDIGGLGIERAQRRSSSDDRRRARLPARGRGGGGFPTGRKWAGLGRR